MSRITGVLDALKHQGKKALIPYITAGDPSPDQTLALMQCLVEAGADIIELGIPFSDPMADGPVIQLACERALAHDVGLKDVLKIVSEFRKVDQDTPVVLMGYLNPIEYMGYEKFAGLASNAGVDGVLAVDLPPEEADSFVPLLKAQQMDAIFLIAPTTSDERIQDICQHSSGYVYYVSVKGVTGSGAMSVDDVAERVATIREINNIPVGVGFGISSAEAAANISKISDGVIVGSVIVNLIDQNQADPDNMLKEISQLVSGMRKAMDN